MKPLYSFCITNFNTANSVRASLESILSQVDERFEIVIVDNKSSDGSLEILKEYERQKKIRLIVTPCSRGAGSRIAIANALGKYTIIMGMDDVLEPKLNELLEIYHKYFEGFLVLVQGIPGVVIGPKDLIEKVGGYRDLNFLEDKDLFSRAAKVGRFRFLKSFKILSYSIGSKRLHSVILSKAKKEYFAFRAAFRLAHGHVFLKYYLNTRLISWVHPFYVLGDLFLAYWGFVTHFFYPRYRNDSINFFMISDFEVNLKSLI